MKCPALNGYPTDLYQLYIAITVITSRFAVLTTTMNIFVLALLGSCAVTGFLSLRWGRLIRSCVLSVALIFVTLIGLRMFFTTVLHNPFRPDEMIADMQLMRQTGSAITHRSPPPPPAVDASHSTALARIESRGMLRVGYLPDRLPFAFFNRAGDLVGFDIEMAHVLAQDMGVSLEFVPLKRGQMASQLNAGYCDLIMSGIAVTPQLARQMTFTQPYLNETLAFLVRDHRRDDFNKREAVRRLQSPRIGVPNAPYFIDKLKDYLPQAEIVVMKSVSEFLEWQGKPLDAFLYTAEAGSAWSLLYPAYTVAIPQPDVFTTPAQLCGGSRRSGICLFPQYLDRSQKTGSHDFDFV